MPRPKKEESTENAKPAENVEGSVIDAPSTAAGSVVVTSPNPAENVAIAEPTENEEGNTELIIHSQTPIGSGHELNTSAEPANQENSVVSVSPELSTVAPVVETDPKYRHKPNNPFSIVAAPGDPDPEPEPTHSEWQPESAPEQRGASLVDPDRAAAAQSENYFYPKEFLEGIGVDACSKCGEGRRTDTLGHLICPVEDPACPRLQAVKEAAE